MIRKPPSDILPIAVLVTVLAVCLLLAGVARGDASVVTEGVMEYRSMPSGEDPASGSEEKGNLPLRKTVVRADVSGFVARVTVQQFFHNPTPNRIEAVYLFPLPANAAVHESVMRIGDRVIRAEIKERKQAKKTYEKAKKQGKKASLLEQERPNIFTQSVANIDPGEEIVTAIQYVQELKYDDNRYTFSFPMTVGPRFNPGTAVGRQGPGSSPDTDLVPDASRITPPYRRPTERSGRDIELEVLINAGFPVRTLASPSHEIDVAWEGNDTVRVSIPPGDRIPNKDFVLDYSTIGPDLETALLTHRDGDMGYFLLMVQPPAEVAPEEAVPKELVFVLDCSGSMSGHPMETSKALMRRFIDGMNPDDSFQVIRFSERASALGPAPIPNTSANRVKGLRYVEELRGSGGTYMIEGIKAALDFPADPDRQRMVFFLTDGFIGNETQILQAIRERIGDTRIYSLGVGSSPNRYLIDEMAREGHGFAQYVRIGEDPGPAVERFYRRLDKPVLTAVEIDWNGLEVIDPMPRSIPDLFDSQPVFLTGRYRKPGQATVFLRGRRGHAWTEIPVPVYLPDREPADASLRLLWARRKIADLMRLQHRQEIPEVREEVLALALEHRLMSKYTSFVAVEKKIRSDVSLPLETILVPSEMPEGVRFEAIFGEATLSMDRIKPGDPVLAVRAPAEALAVLAEFPFGLRKSLERDPETGLWSCRFLVPRGEKEGRYTIRIRIVLPNGDWVDTMAQYIVDSTPPRFGLETRMEGRTLHFVARPLEGVFDEKWGDVQATVLPDVMSVVVRPPQGGVIRLRPVDTPDGPVWTGAYELPSWYRPGRYTFRLYAVDEARNAFSLERGIRIPSHDGPAL